MKYEILVTSILGLKGQVVDLPDNSQTAQRLKKGIIAPYEQKVVDVVEQKVVEPSERKRRTRKSVKSD